MKIVTKLTVLAVTVSLAAFSLVAQAKNEATSFFEQLAEFVGDEAPEEASKVSADVIDGLAGLPFTDPVQVTETLAAIPEKLEEALDAKKPSTPEEDLEAVVEVVTVLTEAAAAAEVVDSITEVETKPLESFVANVSEQAPVFLEKAVSEVVENLTEEINSMSKEAIGEDVPKEVKEQVQDVLELVVDLRDATENIATSSVSTIEASVGELVEIFEDVVESLEDVISNPKVEIALEAAAEEVKSSTEELIELIEPLTPQPAEDLVETVESAASDDVVTQPEVLIIQDAVAELVQDVEEVLSEVEIKGADPEVVDATKDAKEAAEAASEAVAQLSEAQAGPELAELIEAVVDAVVDVKENIEQATEVAGLNNQSETVEQIAEVVSAVEEAEEVLETVATTLAKTATLDMSLAEAAKEFLTLPSRIEDAEKNSSSRVSDLEKDIERLKKALENVGQEHLELKAKLAVSEKTLRSSVSKETPYRVFDIGSGKVLLIVFAESGAKLLTLESVPVE